MSTDQIQPHVDCWTYFLRCSASNHFKTRGHAECCSTAKVRPIQAEELSTPVQCETNPLGLNGVVVYGDRTYALTHPPVAPLPPYVNRQLRDYAPSADNSNDVGGELEQRQSLEEIHHQMENLVLLLCRYWTSSGRRNALSHCPLCHSDTRQRGPQTWRSLNYLLAAAVIILLFIVFYHVFL